MRTRGFGVDSYQKLINKLNALKKGKRVMETVPNPKASNRAFVRQPMKRKEKYDLFSSRK